MLNFENTDPQYNAIIEHFAFDQVANDPTIKLNGDDHYLAILATLIGCHGLTMYQTMLSNALDDGFDPIKAKETVYQATDYLGLGRVIDFVGATNTVFEAHHIPLSTHGDATVDRSTRLEGGYTIQAAIFGDHMKTAWKEGTINTWLAANCFGDYYTRTGLDLRERELITFCFLLAQGGCEPQLIAHAKGNMNMGNDDQYLKKIILNVVPYIGYPRSLNAINAVEKASK